MMNYIETWQFMSWSLQEDSVIEENLVETVFQDALNKEPELFTAQSLRDEKDQRELRRFVSAVCLSLIRHENASLQIDFSDCPYLFDAQSEPLAGSNDPRYLLSLLAAPEIGFIEIVSSAPNEHGVSVPKAFSGSGRFWDTWHYFLSHRHDEEPFAAPAEPVSSTEKTTAANEESADSKQHRDNAERKANLYDHSRPFDVHRWSDHPEANAFVDRIYEEVKSTGNHRIRKKHLKVILLDLYVAWLDDPDLMIAIARGSDAYKPKGRYNELHISKITPRVLDELIAAGYIVQAKGFNDRRPGGKGRNTRIGPTKKLVALFEDAKFGPLDIGNHEGRETIILRDEDKNDVVYEDTAETNRMRAVLTAYNKLIRQTFIDIPMLEKARIPLGKGKQQYLYINQADKFTRRIFNRGSWEKGGRFYGGWWQRCPKHLRGEICINNKHVNEIDYSGLHVVMLYALEGIDYWKDIGSDPYDLKLPGLEELGVPVRSVCKQLVLVAVNARNAKQAFRAFRDEAEAGSIEKKLKDKELKPLLAALKEKHKPISHRFASDAGIDLMNLDAQITERLIEQFTAEGIPILSLHDSYIVPFSAERKLRDRMQKAFEEVMEGSRAKVVPSIPILGGFYNGARMLTEEPVPISEFKIAVANLKKRTFLVGMSKRYQISMRRFIEWRKLNATLTK